MEKKLLLLFLLVSATQSWAANFHVINNTSCNIDFVSSRESTNVTQHEVPDHIGAHSKGTVKFKGDGTLRFREIFSVSCGSNQPEYIINQLSYFDNEHYRGAVHLACAPTDDFIDCDHALSGKLHLSYRYDSLDFVLSVR